MAELSGMFDGLDPGDPEAIGSAVGAMLARRAALGLEGPWSYAELTPSEGDARWLAGWAASLAAGGLSRWVGSTWDSVTIGGGHVGKKAAAGLVLLAHVAEVARRQTGGGAIWAAVRRTFPDAVRFLLFGVGGQPQEIFKGSIRSAVEAFGLRHRLGEPGHLWYRTVLIQVGFTLPGARERLADWLVAPASRPLSLQELIDGPDRSPAVHDLLRTLFNLRRNNVTERQARRAIDDCRWVPSGWADVLVAGARRRSASDTGGDWRPAAEGGAGVAGPGPEGPLRGVPPFLSEPRLSWAPGTPDVGFAFELVDLASQPLSADDGDHELRVEGEGGAVRRLLAQEDGSFDPYPDGTVRLRPAGPSALARLAPAGAAAGAGDAGDAGEATAVAAELTYWDAEREVTLFRLADGKRLGDGDLPSIHSEHAAVVSPGCGLSPEPASWQTITPDGWRVAHLPKGDAAAVRVTCGGRVVYAAPADAPADSRRHPAAPDWVARCDARVLPDAHRPFAEPFRLRIAHPADAAVDFVRVDGVPIEFAAAEVNAAGAAATRAGPVAPGAERTADHLLVHLGLVRGVATACLRLRVPISAYGAARQGDSGAWEPLGTLASRMTVRQGLGGRFRVVPRGGGGAEVSVLEGARVVGRLSGRPSAFSGLQGYGAALVARKVHSGAGHESLTVTASVINHGVLVRAEVAASHPGWGLAAGGAPTGGAAAAHPESLELPASSAEGGSYESLVGDDTSGGGVEEVEPPDAGEVAGTDGASAPDPAHFWALVRPAVEPDDGHRLHVWGDDGVVELVPERAEANATATLWRAPWPGSAPHRWRAAVASYKGVRLGALCKWGWVKVVPESTVDPAEAARLARLMRWARPPMLDAESLPSVRAFARANAGPVLSAWTSPDGGASGDDGTSGIVFDDDPLAWRSVVREVFRGWRPDADSGSDVVAHLCGGSAVGQPDALGCALWPLLDLDPLLAGGVARGWAERHGDESMRLNAKFLRLALAGGSSEAQAITAERRAAWRATELIGVDELLRLERHKHIEDGGRETDSQLSIEGGYVWRLAASAVERPAERASDVRFCAAMEVEPFARLLGLLTLKELSAAG